MKNIKKIRKKSGILNWRIIILIPLLIFLIVVLYGFMTLLGAIIPVNQNRTVPSEGKLIYLVNNGYHIALVLPRDSCTYGDIFNVPLGISGKGGFFYFGWGDRQFYLGTPTVRNIDWLMAAKALFTPSSAALEVLYICSVLPDQTGVSSLFVTEDELVALYGYVEKNIMVSDGLPKQILSDEIDPAFYGSIFFEASGSYSLFNTCNNWTSRGLKESGLRTHLWTPFTWGVE